MNWVRELAHKDINSLTDAELRMTLLEAVCDGKRRLKAKYNATAEQCREAARGLAARMLAFNVKEQGMTPEESMALLQRAGVYDKRGRLTPEYGGEPRKEKVKKKRR